MTVERRTARTGDPTVLANGRFLHSRYDPRREARRFTDSLTPENPESVTILLGDGTGVVRSALTDRFPSMRVISVEPVPQEGEPATDHTPRNADRLGAPPEDAPETTADRLHSRLHPLDAGRIQVLTWSGARTAIPEWCSAMETLVLEVMRSLQAELATTGSFGRLWLANAVRGTVRADRRVSVRFEGDGLVTATAGPGLSALARRVPPADRPSLPIIAAGSAVHWLNHQGFHPFLAVQTDGGLWARRYLKDIELARAIALQPLRAAGGRVTAPLYVRTGWFGEVLAPDAREWPFLREYPTVGASLLDLAHRYCPDGTLVASGLDLCTRGLLGHSSPHRNDRYIRTRIARLASEETLRASRAAWADSAARLPGIGDTHYPGGAWQTPALAAYRRPVATVVRAHRETGTTWFLDPSPVWSREAPLPDTAPLPRGRFLSTNHTRPDRKKRMRHVETTLRKWQEQVRRGSADPDTVTEELRDLMLHLAPVETLQWYRGTLATDRLRSRVLYGLEGLSQLLERLG